MAVVLGGSELIGRGGRTSFERDEIRSKYGLGGLRQSRHERTFVPILILKPTVNLHPIKALQLEQSWQSSPILEKNAHPKGNTTNSII